MFWNKNNKNQIPTNNNSIQNLFSTENLLGIEKKENYTEIYFYTEKIINLLRCSKYIIKFQWFTDDYSFVNEGDEIGIIKLIQQEENIEHIITCKSEISGLLIRGFEKSISHTKQKLYYIYPNISEYKKEFPNEFVINIDDFTNTTSIKSKICAGGKIGFILKRLIYVNFEHIGNINFLTIRYTRKDINLNKKSILHLLLEDGSVIMLTPTSNPIKHIECPSNSIIKYTLSLDNLKLLEEKKFIKWQIINEDGLQISSGNNDCCIGKKKFYECCYEIDDTNNILLNLSQDVFQDFIKDFNKLIKENTPKEELQQKEETNEILSNKNDTCFVYLMIDTTNNFHKIGISNNPKYREHTLQSDKPTIELIIAKEYPTRLIAEAIEFALHKAYSNKRIRGEWFNLDDIDIIHIKETLK